MAKGWRKPKRPCSVTDCPRDAKARGLCGMHHRRWLTHGDATKVIHPRKFTSLADAIAGKHSVRQNGCWEWTRGTRNGYGVVSFQGSNVPAHRASWIAKNGAIPSGLVVCHRCDNPPCVNPDHLFLGTSTDNNRDMLAKGRMKHNHAGKTHCKHGHEFTAENTRISPSGVRVCRSCERESGRKKSAQRTALRAVENRRTSP